MFWMKLMVRTGIAFGTALVFSLLVAKAEPGDVIVFTTDPQPALSNAGVQPSISRRYEVQTDPETGRLIRVRAGKGRLVKASRAKSGRAAPGITVVQGRGRTQADPAVGRLEIDSLVSDAGRRHGVDPALVHAVIRQESNYHWLAVSVKGACGLMQLMPATAKRFGVKNIFDPAENVEGGVKYLRHLLDRYDGNSSLALAAYNAGEGAVDRFGGIPPFRETREYVGRVSRSWGSFDDSVSTGLRGDVGRLAREPRVVARVTSTGLIRFEME